MVRSSHSWKYRDQDRLGYSVGEFAENVGCSRQHIYHCIRDGKIHAVKIGARTIIPASEIDRIFTRSE
jgi:excisionase family DNA binding protein